MDSMTTLVTAAGILGDAKGIGTDVKDLLINVATPLAGVIFALWVWGNTKSAVKTLVATVMAGAIWWGVANMDALRDKTGEDLDGQAAAQVLVLSDGRDHV
ncbi:hypothetical protein [Streptomyces sp. NPDC087300]|uniref:hypothetical protein n=1 Tax=Streptomyces sp. NPDC087300 TaxID=3365780 RepID=UPI003808239B